VRDYRKGAIRRSHNSSGFSGWIGLLLGLTLGVVFAIGVWRYAKPSLPEAPSKDKPAAPLSATEEAQEQETTGSGTKFTFYKQLKNFEVIIPEKEKDVHSDVKPIAETRQGTYVLQAGSYKNYADADRVRAQLALQGIESNVQKVTVDADTWHRVRIGPISNLEDLNKVRTRLRKADVEALVIRVGD
jgi:cell division protein FtsN